MLPNTENHMLELSEQSSDLSLVTSWLRYLANKRTILDRRSHGALVFRLVH
jgi:hypothetical protein